MKNIPTLLLLLFFGGNVVFAQGNAVSAASFPANAPQQKIGEAIATYFDLDRETIYAHFDKSVFFTNEEIWFKGYCFNKKQGSPFFETTNVFAVLFDEDGRQISEQLVFSYIGTFQGNFKLGPQLKSGQYYIRFYTNWMNNFPEDESARYAVQIINENEQVVTEYNSPDYSKINISFHPEGGHFVAGVVNNLGIRVTDCDGNPIETRDAKIIAANGETVSNFLIGKNGCGKTYITPDGTGLKAVIVAGGKTVEASLPDAADGLALEVNNYALPDKTIVKIRVNPRKVSQYSKPLFVVAQQNNKSTVFEIKIKGPENEIVISNSSLYAGVNVIRVLDENLQELAQRIICDIPNNTQEFVFSNSKKDDKIKIVGHSNFPNADISISVLPEQSKAAPTNDLTGAFLVDPYLTEKLPHANYFLDNPTKAKRYELDLFLLNQDAGKYDWRNIKNAPAKTIYDFDIGLKIKGTINQNMPDPKKYRVLLSSPLSLINDYSAIDEKKEFLFPNLVFANVANFRFTVMKIPSDPVNMTFIHQVYNRKRTFNKPFVPLPEPCSAGRLVPLDAPQFGADVIALDNVELTGRVKSDLKYRTKFGNAGLRGYKIDNGYNGMTLLQFIESNGFGVTRRNGNVFVTSGRGRTTITGQVPTPEIYVNSRKLFFFDELDDINMNDVDEIYLNSHAIVASMNNNAGVIKIYMKKIDYGNAKSHTKNFAVQEGFAPLNNFEMPFYISTTSTGFEKYGIIHWVPTVLTDSNGDFTFEIPKTDTKNVTLHIRGFTPEGKMISVDKVISLE
jgi:hypothetical protein